MINPNRRRLLIEYAKKMGICSQCLRRDARQGFSTCEKCAKNNLLAHQASCKKPGNCSRCGRKLDQLAIDKGRKTCTKCRPPKMPVHKK